MEKWVLGPVKTGDKPHEARVRLSHSFTRFFNPSEIETILPPLLPRGVKVVEIDCTELTNIDVDGIASFYELWVLLAKQGVELKIANMDPKFHTKLDCKHLESVGMVIGYRPNNNEAKSA